MCSSHLTWQHIWGQHGVISGPPTHEVPFVVTGAVPSFSSQGHPLALCVLAFWAGTEQLPWAWWSWRKAGRAHAKGTGALQKVAQG